MAQVEWAGVLSVQKKTREKPQRKHLPWVELCKPTESRQIKGNRQSVEKISDWFNCLQCSYPDALQSTPCLFVYGPSGVWKSSSVVLCASEHGFNVVHTHSDSQRTPQKLDAVVRKLGMGDGPGVLLLDEFESFIKETTSLKWLSKVLRSPERVPVVIVCNAVDKSFHSIRDLSTVVEFLPYRADEIYSTLLALSSKVSGFCHLPAMDCYFIASMCSGNVCQAVNQVQILYYGSKPLAKKKSKRPKIGKVQSKCMQDSPMKMWSNSHRATSVDCFLGGETLLESVAEMNQGFMFGLGENLVRDYPLYFHNSTTSTLDVIASCAENLSAANCGLGSEEVLEDRMYESENSDLWSTDNVNFIGYTCAALRLLRNRAKNKIVLPRKRLVVFKYD